MVPFRRFFLRERDARTRPPRRFAHGAWLELVRPAGRWRLPPRFAMPARVGSVALLALLVLPGSAASAADCEQAHKRVLLLFSQRTDFGFSAAAAADFVQTLRTGVHGCLDDYSEYLEAAQFGETDQLPIFRDFIARKYAGMAFDLIITFQRPALTFMTRYRDEIFPGVPVFFVAGKGLETENRAPLPDFSGALYKVDLRPTLDVALRLHPEVTDVVVVSGASPFDQGYERGVREQFAGYTQRIRLTYLAGTPIEELQATVGGFSSHHLVFLMSYTADRGGNRFIRSEAAARIARASAVPVYSPYAVLLGHGIVGGSVISVEQVLQAAAPSALRVLAGGANASPRVEEVDSTLLQFDARQLQRFGIDERHLPVGGVVRFRAPGLWQEHRTAVLTASAVVLLQTAMLSGLLVQRHRRRRAEADARALAGRLLHAAEEERTRIARDLHDDVCQELSVLAVDATFLKSRVATTDGETRQVLDAFRGRTAAIAERLRRLSHDLHPAALQHASFLDALRAHCAEVERQHGLRILFGAPPQLPAIHTPATVALYRIVQEALRNAVQHGEAVSASIQVRVIRNRIRLSVTDDGAGFELAVHRPQPGLGLVSMQERARLLGGWVDIESSPGRGTTVTVDVPLSTPDTTNHERSRRAAHRRPRRPRSRSAA